MHVLGDSIPFALSEADKRVYEPRAVPLGKNCGCVCPGCRQPVIAKHCMSGKRAPHFAHAAGYDCASGFETALHLAAKQLIETRGVLAFPELIASIKVWDDMGHVHEPALQLVTGGLRRLCNVVLEKSLGQIRPDLRVDADGLGTVLVEVAVTHFVDDRKLKQIRHMGIPALEIDLSMCRDATFAALEVALFDKPSGTTKWLYHPGLAEAECRLRESLRDVLSAATESAEARARSRAEIDAAERIEEAARQAEREVRRRTEEARQADTEAARLKEVAERKRITDEAQRIQRYEDLKKAAVFKARPEERKRQAVLSRLGRSQLPAFLAAKVRGAMSFGVEETLLWQVTLFGGLVHQQPAKGNGWIGRNYARAWMRYRFPVPQALHKDANDAIDDYLMALAVNGALIACRNNSYAITVADLTCFETLIAIRNSRNFDPGRLQWTPKEEWPTEQQAWTVAEGMSPNLSAAGRWFKLASEMHRNIGFPPIVICEWGSQVGGTKESVANYLVRAGYLRLAPNGAAAVTR